MTDILTQFQDGPSGYPPPDFGNYRVRTLGDQKPWPPVRADIRSILILKLDALGDYVLHTPFFAHLRAFYPDAKITLVANKLNVPMAELNPALDDVLPLPTLNFDQGDAFLFAMELQAHAAAPFDLVIVPRWSEDWYHAGPIAQMVDAPYRLSYSGNATPQKMTHFPDHDEYFTHVIDDQRPCHEVWRGMQLLHALGMDPPPVEKIQQQLFFAPEDSARITQIMNTALPRPWIGLSVGGSGSFKRWPAAAWAELTPRIANEVKGTCFILGNGSDDEKIAETILASGAPHVVNTVGQFSVRETALAIKACNALVANDSFAIHAAATVGTPVAEVVGQPADGNPTSDNLPLRFGPWGVPFGWVHPATCRGASVIEHDFRGEEKCISEVPMAPVFDLLVEVMRRWPKPTRD